MSSLSATAARGGAVTLGFQLARMVLQAASVIILARLLAPSIFGLIAMVTAVIGVAELVRDFGLSIASVQAKHVSVSERNNLFWANTGLGLACAVAAVASTPLLVRLYGEARLARLVPPLALVFVMSGMNTQYRADLARRLRFFALAMSDLVAPTLGIGLAILLALRGAGVWALVVQQLVVALSALVLNAANARWVPGRYDKTTSIRKYFRFGIGILGTQLLTYVTGNVDNVVLGAVRGPVQLGLYSRAYQLLMVPLFQINAPLTNVAVPVLSRVQEDRKALGDALRRAQLVACYVTGPVLIIAAALAQPMVLVLLGPQWGGLSDIFAVLAVGGLFRSISQVAYWTYLSTGATGSLLRLQLWTQPIMVLLIVAGVPWGGTGVAAGHLVASAGYWVASLIAVGRTTGVAVRPLFVTATTAVLGIAVPTGFAAWGASTLLAGKGPWVQLALGGLAAVATGVIIGLVVPPVRRDAIVMVATARQMVRRRA